MSKQLHLCLLALGLLFPAQAAPIVDSLTFGNAPSEQSHQVSATLADVVSGGLGESARRLLPPAAAGWEGGQVAFTMKVDPALPNYFTGRFWGGEFSENRLVLFCEGKQSGLRHIGDVDLLDFGNDSNEPPFNGRFFYKTLPLPLAMTKGKSELHFEIRSIGRIWPYGTNFEQYQKPMTAPARGLYRVYTHTDGFFAPPADEKQGAPFRPFPGIGRGAGESAPVAKEPGAEIFDVLKKRVNWEVNKQLTIDKPTNQPLAELLARAYFVKWTLAYQNPQVIEQALKFLDAIFLAYRKDPKLAQSDPSTYNPEWFGLGPSGHIIALLAAPLRPRLDEEIADEKGGKITRRAAYAEMLIASRDWHRRHRRQYTNQSQINDLYGIYLSNRGVAVVDPAQALPEAEVRHYLYESIGLQPWLGSDTDTGPAKPLGDNYWQLTPQGLTKELGYVGYYGEVLDWVTQIYNATRPAPGQAGDEKIKAQLIKIAHARAPFRYPALDAQGNRAMRSETIVGWRDEHYPGGVTYAQRASWDASPIGVAAAMLDPSLIGAAQQMFEDNQFFASLRDQMDEKSFRATIGLLDAPDEYDLLKAQPPTKFRLPMAPGQPDFVFADEEDGVVALKNGDEILYASLYWRARFAINFLARVHYVTPQLDRIATVRQDEQFTPSGLTYRRPDEANAPYPWIPRYPVALHAADAGEELPIAKIPEGMAFKPGQENVYAGRADFYQLRYGPYLIGMNTTPDKTFTLTPPAGLEQAQELVSGKTVKLNQPLAVAPRSTVVLDLRK